MIKAKELRIGNYVATPNQKLFRIDAFEYLSDDFGKVAQGVDKNYHPLTWYLDNLDPILLTPDILESCGFKKSLNNTCYGMITSEGKNRFSIFSDGRFKFHTEDLSVKVKYLHQLQNLHFTLTAEELEVNI